MKSGRVLRQLKRPLAPALPLLLALTLALPGCALLRDEDPADAATPAVTTAPKDESEVTRQGEVGRTQVNLCRHSRLSVVRVSASA